MFRTHLRHRQDKLSSLPSSLFPVRNDGRIDRLAHHPPNSHLAWGTVTEASNRPTFHRPPIPVRRSPEPTANQDIATLHYKYVAMPANDRRTRQIACQSSYSTTRLPMTRPCDRLTIYGTEPRITRMKDSICSGSGTLARLSWTILNPNLRHRHQTYTYFVCFVSFVVILRFLQLQIQPPPMTRLLS